MFRDMIGWQRPDQSIVLAYMNRSVDMELTEISMQITRTYVPEIGVDFTSGCCSDQQSFFENGFPAVGFFESERACRPPTARARAHNGDGGSA